MRGSRFPPPTYVPRMDKAKPFSLCLRFSCGDIITWHKVKFVGQCVLFSSSLTWEWMACLVLDSVFSWHHLCTFREFLLMIRGSGGWEEGPSVVKRAPLGRDHWLSVVTGFHNHELKDSWVLQWKDSNGQWCDPDSHHKMPSSVFLISHHLLLSTALSIPRNLYRQSWF